MTAKNNWLSPNDLQDMLINDPRGQSHPDFSFGILKSQLRGRINSAVDFARGKLQPRRPTSEEEEKARPFWAKTAADWQVILAPGVSDDFQNPELLFGRFQAQCGERAKALLVCTTLRYGDATNTHDAMLDGVLLAGWLARHRALSTLIIQHVPALAGSPNPMHLHLLTICGAMHTPLCFGAPDLELSRDSGQQVVFDLWMRLKREWG